jgi:hypothetical protein
MKAKYANFSNILVENFDRKVSLYGRTLNVWVNSNLGLKVSINRTELN